MTPEEAELAKLFTNVWRYVKFATANQLYMMANDRGLDFERIRAGLTAEYPRAADMPGPGFRGGAVSFQGHDAARRVQQQQQFRARAHRDGDQRGVASLSRRQGRASLRFVVDDGRHPGDGVQGSIG
ncbi:hypothetical protein [Fodinicola feengrottensis]|uniref:hypothetical protein n=1 Tax=Fodinicola feengrottensis TaxID=435914 RepID=UPI0036F2ADC6